MVIDLKRKQEIYKARLEDLEMIYDHKKENYPVAYHNIKGSLDIINYILNFYSTTN